MTLLMLMIWAGEFQPFWETENDFTPSHVKAFLEAMGARIGEYSLLAGDELGLDKERRNTGDLAALVSGTMAGHQGGGRDGKEGKGEAWQDKTQRPYQYQKRNFVDGQPNRNNACQFDSSQQNNGGQNLDSRVGGGTGQGGCDCSREFRYQLADG